MKKRKSIILIGVLTGGLFLSLVATSVAWFSTMTDFQTAINGRSTSNYYAGGDGSQNDPFIIKTSKHLYNLTWLQNNGYYPHTQKTYFKLDNDINMAGQLSGYSSSTTGAIPPIGTDAYPFYGEFDGNGKTISNLWISSDPYDWKVKPLNIGSINVGASTGFFGNIGNISINPTTAVIGTVKSFYLENVEVTNKVNDSAVGIVAGYNNGNMEAIGVKNAKISLGTTNIEVMSSYSLIGKIGPYVSWDSLPEDLAGGDLLIDTNFPSFTTKAINTVTAVPDSATDTAFFIGSVTAIPVDIKGSLFKYNSKMTVNTSATSPTEITAESSNITLVTSSNWTSHVTPDFYNRTLPNNLKMATFGITPPSYSSATSSFSNTSNITLYDGTTFPVPKNSIWFKPIKGGVSALVFARQRNAAEPGKLSVYYFKREGSAITNFGEVRFQIGQVGNKSQVYFDFEILQATLDDDYEFIISASNTNNDETNGFLYLMLAGSDEASGAQASAMKSVDYVYRTQSGALENVGAEDYMMKRTLLRFNGTYSGTAYYNTKDYPNIDGKVYYAVVTSSGLHITDYVTTGTVGVSTTYTSGMFPGRDEEFP